MDYDFRNKASSPYDAYNRSPTSASTAPMSHPIYGQPFYPRVGQSGHNLVPPAGRHPSYHQSSSHPPASPTGAGIRVTVKPEYRITPPPQLSPLVGEVPRSKFHFDFDFERKILAEAEKGIQDWSKLGLELLPSKPAESTPQSGPAADPVVSKYIASGLDREAVPLAVANYGDNPTKVREFVSGYALLREMGFSSNNVAEALIMYENDTDKALAHFLNSSS